ncbi:MAG: MATE family efflux transporter [Streptococcaceae bacterium]|jgi:putative MATE family efflux protein|nr:MATE family efflux transporter [Streptococcaceae bacterium]
MNDLTKGSILKGIVWFTVPLLIGNFFQVFYATVDTLIVGQTLGPMALAAVGATGAINFLIVGFTQGMTGGLSIIIAQRFGAKDEDGVKKSFFMGLMFTIGVSLVLGLISSIFLQQILEMMQTPADLVANARNFMYFGLGGMIVPNLYAYLSNAMRSLGNSKTPLYAIILASILNIGLEYLFILGLHTGVWGAGLATLISQAFSVVFLIIYIKKKVLEFHFNRSDMKFDKKEVKEHSRLGFPMAFQTSIIAIGSITLQVALNMLGENAVASNSIASKVDQFAMLPMISLGLAMATFAGQNFGAKRYKRINEGLRRSLVMGISWSAVFAVLLQIFHFYVTTAFITSSATKIIELTKIYYIANSSFYWVLSILFITRSTLQGLGNAKIPTICGFMELGSRVIVAIIGVSMMSYQVVVFASPLAWIASTSILIPTTIKMYRSYQKAKDGESLQISNRKTA